jgi:hypothetical protein
LAEEEELPPGTAPGAAALTADQTALYALLEQFQGANLGDTSTLGSVYNQSLSDDQIIEQRQQAIAYGKSAKAQRAYLPGGASAGQVTGFKQRMNTKVTEKTKVTTKTKLDELVRQERKDPEAFLRLQLDLFKGGFFQPSVRLEEIQAGTLDDTTLDAYYNLMQWTARYNAAGEDVTTEDVLRERSEKGLGILREQLAKARSGGGGGGGNIVSLADPAGLAQALHQVAQQTIGRKATADEQRMFVSMFHAMQSGAQSAESGTVVNPDVQGQAEQMLRQQAPVEAQAHDISTTFNSFLKIIQGVGQ